MKDLSPFEIGWGFARGFWLFTISIVLLPAVIFAFVFYMLGFIPF